jgi:hypothetical protein
MLDTVVMTTEHLEPDHYTIIQEQLQARYGVSAGTGEVAYLHYTASIAVPLTGAPLRLQVRTSKWVKMPGERSPHKIDGFRSLRVEVSIHKAMHGHNVYGGPREPQEALYWLVNLVSELLSCPMPPLHYWYIRRLDIAESFDLGSLENVRGWIQAKKLVVYPRREVHFWGNNGFAANGTTTTLRAYAKGIQFHAEGGYKQLLQCRDAAYAFEVSRIAEKTLRCETEIKDPVFDKLDEGGRADTLTSEWLHKEMYEKSWRQFLRPIDSDSRLVHTAVEVEARLRATYPDPARVLGLYSVWCLLAVRGEGWYRTQVAGSTWRKQRAALEKAFVSWESTNVLTVDCPGSIQDFFPSLTCPERLTEILPYERLAG